MSAARRWPCRRCGRATTVVNEPSSRSEGAHLVFEFQERADVARLMKEIEGVVWSSHSPSSAGIERHNRAKPGIYSAAPFKPQNLTEREDHEHEYLSRCFPWQQNQPENGGMDGPSRRAAAGKGTRGNGRLEGMGRKAPRCDRRHGWTARQDQEGHAGRHRGYQQRDGRLHPRARGFARSRREAVRKPSALRDIPGRIRGDHAGSAHTRRVTRGEDERARPVHTETAPAMVVRCIGLNIELQAALNPAGDRKVERTHPSTPVIPDPVQTPVAPARAPRVPTPRARGKRRGYRFGAGRSTPNSAIRSRTSATSRPRK